MLLLLLFLLVLAVAGGGYLFVVRQSSPPDISREEGNRSAEASEARSKNELPGFDHNRALRDLYGVAGLAGRAGLGAGESAEVAVAKEIDDGDQRFYVVIAQVDERDKPGRPATRRFGRGAKLGAVIYRLARGQWEIEARNPRVAEFGAPDQLGGGWEPGDTDLVRIGPDKRALLLCATYLIQGLKGSSGGVFELTGGGLVGRGYIPLDEENSAVCAQGLAALFGGAKPCYQHTGTIQPLVGSNVDYYDLVVRRKGTSYELTTHPETSDGAGAPSLELVAATDVVYRYDGSKYALHRPME